MLDFFFLQVKYRKIYFKTRGLVFYPLSSYIMNLFKILCKFFCTSKHELEFNLILESRNLYVCFCPTGCRFLLLVAYHHLQMYSGLR
uniref:Uncharacterized protein n=1 Tax=Populus trichocarpa TaxID=3694 RepID=A0A3N7HEP1_POPTR